ncbi:MAG: serine/threonine protein kinase [Myxococcales bacterium]|nr:serine/threonine protein kinase [Myxococcales bacterium]
MELVRGSPLRNWMGTNRITIRGALAIVQQIAEGLAELHSRGVVHGDLKPENVMLTEQGAVTLLDFGLARRHSVPDAGANRGGRSAAPASRSASGFSGTPGYMAPERFDGRPLDPRVDVFALGAVVCELLAGTTPFGDRPLSVVRADDPEPSLPGGRWSEVPAGLRALAARMMSRDPDRRPVDGAEVLRCLREAIPLRAVVPTRRWRGRSRGRGSPARVRAAPRP